MSTLAINFSARPVQPALSPEERKALCSLRSTAPLVSLHAPPAPPSLPSRPSVAVCFFGLLARYRHAIPGRCSIDRTGTGCTESIELTRALAYPTFATRVLGANPQYEVDVFLHTWTVAHEDELRRLFKPRGAAFGMARLAGRTIAPRTAWFGWPGDASPGMFASIDIVLELKREAELARGAVYDFVLLTRPDLMWLSDFRFEALNPTLFYMANYCEESMLSSGCSTRTTKLRTCRNFRTCENATEKHACRLQRMVPSATNAPDWYFAGSSDLIDVVFHNLTWDLERYCFNPTYAMSSNHKVIAGRLESLKLWGRVGRYLHHGYDLIFIRSIFVEVQLPVPSLGSNPGRADPPDLLL